MTSYGMVRHEKATMLQAVKAVRQGEPSLRARYMTALGEWLVQQGTAKEAGKEILLGAAALLNPPRPPTPKGNDPLCDSSQKGTELNRAA